MWKVARAFRLKAIKSGHALFVYFITRHHLPSVGYFLHCQVFLLGLGEVPDQHFEFLAHFSCSISVSLVPVQSQKKKKKRSLYSLFIFISNDNLCKKYYTTIFICQVYLQRKPSVSEESWEKKIEEEEQVTHFFILGQIGIKQQTSRQNINLPTAAALAKQRNVATIHSHFSQTDSGMLNASYRPPGA